MRGQSGIEYIAIVGVLVIVFLPLAFIFSSGSDTTTRALLAKQATNTIADKVNEVHSLGGRVSIVVDMPNGVQEAYVYNRSVVLVVAMGDQNSTAISIVKEGTYLNGTLPTSPGKHTLYIEKINQTHVNIET